jgi:hypothetical protein
MKSSEAAAATVIHQGRAVLLCGGECTSILNPCVWAYPVPLCFSFELAWPSFIKAFADGFRQDGSASPITTPNPFAVVQSEDIVDAIAIVLSSCNHPLWAGRVLLTTQERRMTTRCALVAEARTRAAAPISAQLTESNWQRTLRICPARSVGFLRRGTDK